MLHCKLICFKHSRIHEKVIFGYFLKKKQKVLKLIKLNIYMSFTKESKSIKKIIYLKQFQVKRNKKIDLPNILIFFMLRSGRNLRDPATQKSLHIQFVHPFSMIEIHTIIRNLLGIDLPEFKIFEQSGDWIYPLVYYIIGSNIIILTVFNMTP